MLTDKEIEKFKLYLNKLLLLGSSRSWFALQTFDKRLILTAELVEPTDIVPIGLKYNWKVPAELKIRLNDSVLILVDRTKHEVVAFFIRGTKIPNGVFDGVERYYQLADEFNFSGSRTFFPDFKNSIWLFFLLGLLVSVFLKLLK